VTLNARTRSDSAQAMRFGCQNLQHFLAEYDAEMTIWPWQTSPVGA
jgi:hypothetical protein